MEDKETLRKVVQKLTNNVKEQCERKGYCFFEEKKEEKVKKEKENGKRKGKRNKKVKRTGTKK